MLDLREIENTIVALENGSTTFDACIKLAALYAVRDRFQTPVESDVVVEELSDVLPAYHKYVDTKRQYQLGEVEERAVITATERLCSELSEFLTVLYTTTELQQSRLLLEETLSNISKIFTKNR